MPLRAVAGCCLLGLALAATGARPRAAQPPAGADDQSAVYVCPMHPDIRGKAGDTCGKCGMTLVPAAADYSPYRLDLEWRPRILRSGEKAHIRFFVRHPLTGATVRTFETVHERVFHLFVLGRDLEYFAHVHPVLHPSGALDVDIAVPHPGPYQLIADFLPSGGAPQLLQRSLVTAGYRGALGAVPRLTPDLADRLDGGVRVTLVPPAARAGREQLLTFELTDAATGIPVTDLEPYLGAAGHLLVASADLSAVSHSHPIAELSSPAAPRIVFQVLWPRGGVYRVWLQFQRGGRLSTVSFTIPVEDAS